MAWLAFTKKAQTRNIALLELKHLFKTLEITSGVPESFWRDPYAVGFVNGYIMGVWLFVAGNRLDSVAVTKAAVDVLFELVPDQALEVAKRFARFHEISDPNFNEGNTNGSILALFLLGTNAVDKEPVVIEARRSAHNMSAVFDSLPTKTDERGNVGIALRQMLFYDRIQKLR
jgi:hypothetical protein